MDLYTVSRAVVFLVVLLGAKFSCSLTGPGNILSLDLSRTDRISQSYRRFVIDSNFIQHVIGKIMHVGFPLWFGIGNRLLEDRSIVTALLCSID